MLPRERVIRVIRHEKPDRIPIYGWLYANLEKEISACFGSVRAFEDRYEFDYAHIFGGREPYSDRAEELEQAAQLGGGEITPRTLLEVPRNDPDDPSNYTTMAADIRYHKEERGRFTYVQTPGIFETLNGPFGIETHLAHLAEYEDELIEIYRRQTEWNIRFAMNALDLGGDMIHISDDWGAQAGLMFNPAQWRRLIYPCHKKMAEAVKKRGAYLSLHSDGNVASVLDGLVELGYDVVHPFQESAGMNLQQFKDRYRKHFSIMGGLDIQTTLGFGKREFLRSEIERVMTMFADGGLLFCTTHFVQNHCSIDELTFAYDTAYEVARSVCR